MGPGEGVGSEIGQLVSSFQRKQINFFLTINTQFREKNIIMRIIN